MPYEISWLIEGHVIHLRSWDVSDNETLASISEDIVKYMDTQLDKTHQVHSITDMTEVTKSGLNMKSMNVIKPMTNHPRSGWYLPFGYEQPLIDLITNTSSQLFRSKYRKMKSFEEAIAFLCTMDPIVDDLWKKQSTGT